MLKLEELTKDALVEEVVPNARLISYRNVVGKLEEQTTLWCGEHRLSLATAGLAWAFDPDSAAFKVTLQAEDEN